MEEQKRGCRVNQVRESESKPASESSDDRQVPCPSEELPEGTEVFYIVPGGKPQLYGKFTSNRWTTGASTKPKKPGESESNKYPDGSCYRCGRTDHQARNCTQEVDIYGKQKGRNPRYGEKPKQKAPRKSGTRVRQVTDDNNETDDKDEPEELRHIQPDTMFAVGENDLDTWFQRGRQDPWAQHLTRNGRFTALESDDEDDDEITEGDEADDDMPIEELTCALCEQAGAYFQLAPCNDMPRQAKVEVHHDCQTCQPSSSPPLLAPPPNQNPSTQLGRGKGEKLEEGECVCGGMSRPVLRASSNRYRKTPMQVS